MTISSETRKAGPFVGNDTTTLFPFAFKVFKAEDVYVVRANSAGVETVLALGTDYTVSLNANQNSNPGGTVTLPAALAQGSRLVVTSDVPDLQPTDLTNQGGFYPKVINDALDRATIQIQQLREQVGRAAKLPLTSASDAEALTADLVRLADSADEIDTVAANIAAVNTNATNIAAIQGAAANAAAAQAAYDSFDDRYLGAKTAAPATDNDGNALLVGATYWDTPSSQMFTWNGTQWRPTFLVGNTVRTVVTATGGQTVLAAPTYLVGSNTIQVFVNGVKQILGTDYTETNQNTVTMAAGLTAGDEVELIAQQAFAVDELRADLASTAAGKGAALVAFKQLGTGAVDRTALAKMRERVSVFDFMTEAQIADVQAGTALLDVAAAIQAALNAIGNNGEVEFPPGVYRIGSTLSVAGSGKTLIGIGRPEIRKVGASNFDAIQVPGSACRVIGLRINGNSVGWSGVFVTGQHNLIKNVTAHNNGGCGILLDGQASTCAYNTVEGCRAYSNGEIGIGQNTALASRILGNICQDNDLEGITIDLPSYRSIVDGNQVIGNCRIGGVGGIGIDQAYLTVISNNVVSGTLSGLPGLTFQCNVGDTTFCSVTGNVFTDNAGGAIRLRKTGAYHSSYNVIDGNVFLNNGGKTIEIDAGCDGNILGVNQYNGVWPIDNGANNRKQAGAVFFRVANNTLRTDVTGDGTWYTVPFEVEQSDPESRVSAGVFTAPMRGLYSFQAAVRLAGGAGHTWGQLAFLATGSTAILGLEVGAEDIFPLEGGTSFLLNAGDTVRVQVRVGGGPGTKVLDVEASPNECWFTGHLIG